MEVLAFDKPEKPTRYESFLIHNDYLIEQIYKSDQVKFAIYDPKTDKIKIQDKIELHNETIKPIDDEAVKLGAVKLPSGIEEYETTADLILAIKNHIKKYVDISPKYLNIAACYVLLSVVYDRFNTLPYLRFLGDTGTGKSRAQNVIGGLCYKAFFASGCITRAVIFRMLKKWKGTLVLDEADLTRSDEYSEIVKILNCGFEKGRPVIRSIRDNPNNIEVLPVYSPKIIATRNDFHDRALEARCLTEIMSETNRTDIASVLNREFDREQELLRNKLLLFRFRHYNKIDPEINESEIDLSGVEPRLRQISAAFIALLKDEPQLLKAYRGFIKQHQKDLIEKRASTNEGQIIAAIFQITGGIDPDNGFPQDVTVVTSVTGEIYLPFGSSEISAKAGFSSQQVGQLMRNLGLKTKVIRVSKKTKRCLLYEKEKLLTLKRRYIPKNTG